MRGEQRPTGEVPSNRRRNRWIVWGKGRHVVSASFKSPGRFCFHPSALILRLDLILHSAPQHSFALNPSSEMTTEKTPDVSQDGEQQIRASVLHGAKDLRIVSLPVFSVDTTFTKLRKTASSSHPAQQTSKSPSAQPASAAPTCITTDTTAMATSSFGSPCPSAMSPRASS